MKPQDLVAKFPVGTMLELSQSARSRIRFLDEVIEAVGYMPKAIQERADDLVKAEDHAEGIPDAAEVARRDRLAESILDQAFSDEPFKMAVSMAAAKSNCGVLQRLIGGGGWKNTIEELRWAVVHADLAAEAKLGRREIAALTLSMSKGGVLVKGYNFSDTDFMAPDTIPGTTEGL